MSPDSASRDKNHHSDPSSIAITPLQGSFHPVSAGYRARSLSPRKRESKQPLHIRLNLTETQMDKITDAFTSKVSRSPSRARHRAEGSPSRRTPRRNQPSFASSQTTRSLQSNVESETLADETTFSQFMPSRELHYSPSLAERRQRAPPAPINTSYHRPAPKAPVKPTMKPVSELVSPLGAVSLKSSDHLNEDDISIYSQDVYLMHPTQPLNLRSNTVPGPANRTGNANTGSHNNWGRLGSPFEPAESIFLRQSASQRPQQSQSNTDGFKHQSVHPRVSGPPAPPQMAMQSQESEKDSPNFSPLPLYFRTHDFPDEKRGAKEMIGHNGWLERTGVSPGKGKKSPQRRAGILDSIKKIAKDMTEFSQTNRRSQQSTREFQPAQMAISMDTREQSLLYCELEFNLTYALNEYISAELDRGHLVPDKLKKIADSWQQLGRPRVVGFRYDLETQLELINLHIGDFSFYGRRQGNPVEIAGLLHAMKVNARAMRVRTFCQPDSVIAKQIVDAQSLFNLIGVSGALQRAMAEIAQFFKVIVEREIDFKEHQSREAQGFQVPQAPVNQQRAATGRDQREPQRSWGTAPDRRGGY